MTTLASPTQGGTAQAIWHVDMRPGQEGPLHLSDTEQVWAILAGQPTFKIEGSLSTVGPGDTVIIAAGATRQVSAGTGAALSAIVVAPAGTRAQPLDGTTPGPGCAVPDGDWVTPAWIA
jgi:quercetin dioxygenase-like cupin family protein